MILSLVAHVTEASGLANEDIAGFSGRFAWVVDGASGVSARTLAEGATDAAWLAGAIDGVLRERIGQGDDPDLATLIHDLQAVLAERFQAGATGSLENDTDGPSACLALLEARASGNGSIALKGAVIGDVAVLVPGQPRWTDERLKPFEAETLDVLSQSERIPVGIPEPVIAQIRRNRLHLNRPGGYHAVHPRLPWADAMLPFEAEVEAGTRVILATDGFLRLCDLFEAVSEADLVRGVSTGEAPALLAALRQLERADPDGRRHLRVKTHDDATVLAVAVDPSETP
jgi:hypothetical protein